MVRFRALFLSLALTTLGCADDGPIAEGLGDTGGPGPEQPLPGGSDCGLNWTAIDGELVDLEEAADEPAEGPLVELGESIAFVHPVDVRNPEPEPSAVDPAFATMSFEEFAQLYARRHGSGWLLQSDQPMSDAQLRRLYDRLRSRAAEPRPSGEPVPASTTYAVDGYDASWSSGRKLNLTWCLGRIMPSPVVNPEQHELNTQRAREITEWATRAWERAADVNFVHLSEYDSPESQGSGDCQPGENGIFFRVRTGPDCTKQCLGVTTGPAVPHNEFVDPSEFESEPEYVYNLQRLIASETETRITALHELGHIMGMRHEHLRWLDEQDSGHCLNTPYLPFRGLTARDPDSVMGYDDCVGISNNQPRLSPLDRLGAYYHYNWGRRRPLMMAPVSSTADFAYDGSERAGIVWQTPRSAELEVWTAAAEPGQPVSFSTEIRCVHGGAPPCAPGFDPEGRTRPLPAWFSGTAADIDVLFHGPGPALADGLMLNSGLSFDPWQLDLDGYAVPVVGSYGAGVDDQILLYRPGPDEDALLSVGPDGVSFVPMNYTGYAYPLPGRYRGFGGGGNDILWYEPASNTFTVWQWLDVGVYEYLDQGVADAAAVGLELGNEYTPLLGDFDGDQKSDIFWYAPGSTQDVMWWSVSNQDAVIFSAATTDVHGEYRPFLGDFDGNGTTDILWFSPYREAVRTTSQIWYFTEERSFSSLTLSTNSDYSPYIADFDSDGCSDILWHRPDSPEESPVWRCLPETRDFACDSPVSVPAGAYPVGYGGAY